MRAISVPSRQFQLPAAVALFALICCAWLPAQDSSAAPAEAAAAIAVRPLITQPLDEAQLTVLKGNTHPLARPEFDLGTAPASLPMQRMLLVLKRSPEQEFALKKLLDDQQDKASPNYHKWLIPEQFGQQFGPTDADIQTITSWLQSHGFEVGSTKGRTVLEFSGSASQVREAFHTAIHKYVVKGEQHWANASDPMIPAALAPAVTGIDSLHNFRKKAMNHYVGEYSEKAKQLTSAKPNYSFACGNGFECYAVVPYDFATIYDVLPLWSAGINGAGETIAIVGRTNINPQDPATFWQLFGVTVPTNKLKIILNGPDPGINGDEGEADIDVQWSGAVAPQATIDFVTSESTETTDGVDLSAVYIVDNNLAPVMSESYGQCELGLGTAGNQFFSALWEQAAAQGISVFVSSGDDGAAGCDNPGGPTQFGLNVNGIASTPFNAAVGGTDFNQYNTWTTYWNSTNNPTTQESAKGYIPETTWNDSCTNGLAVTLGYGTTAEQACNNPNMIAAGGVNSIAGSGGPSNCVVNGQTIGSCTQGYAKPSWQSGAGVPNDHLRDLPDISLFASNGFLSSFYVICLRDATGGICDLNNFAGFGGTSVSSPAFAGIMALVNQKVGSPQGVPGFVLYKLAAKQASAFHDIPSGSTIATPCFSGTPNCTVSNPGDQYGVLSGYSTGSGYDLATGLGSVDAANLVNNWNKVTFTSTTTTLQLNSGNPVKVKHGTPVPVNIGITPTAAGGEAALLVSTGTATTTGQPIDDFVLSGGSFSGNTSLLPGGTYNVIAHYAGDGTYGGSYSSPVSVTVSQENSQVQAFLVTFDAGGNIINPNTTTAVYGSPYLMRVNVVNSQGNLCDPVAAQNKSACPSGSIALTDNGSSLDAGTYTLNSFGYFEDQTVQLPGGTNSVKASYAGDNSFTASSATSPLIISRAPTGVNPPSVQNYSVGSAFTASAIVQSLSSGVPPTGTVTFYSNGTPVTGTTTYQGGNQVGPPAVAWLTVNFTSSTSAFTTPGNYTITASYSGDGNYAPDTSSGTGITVQYPAPGLGLSPSVQSIAIGATATLNALVDSSNKSFYPTGMVSFLNSQTGAILAGPISCTSTKDSSGNYACQASGSFTVNAAVSVNAQYSGDTNYPMTTSNVVQVNVNDFAIGTGGASVTMTQGTSGTVPVNITDLGAFNGTVGNFTCSGLPAETTCSFNPTQVSGQGSTTLTIMTTPLGHLRWRVSAEQRWIWWKATEAVFLIGVCLIGVPSRNRRWSSLLALMILFGTFLSMPGCGGGGSVVPPPTNPVPSVSSLSPSQMAAGSAPQALTITGSGFISASSVTLNGVAHAATFSSAGTLSIQLSSADLASTGAFPVVVTNPSPGGGASGKVNFNVVTGTPTGTFNVTVTASSGGLTHSTTFTLNVQ